MKLLEINHCKKAFDELGVIHDISLSVSEGEVVAIIGPSGSGKSTLLRCATLLERMDSGDLIYLGEYAAQDQNGSAVYADKRKLREIQSYFGLVFQNFNLFPHYSVKKNIMDAPIHVQKKIQAGICCKMYRAACQNGAQRERRRISLSTLRRTTATGSNCPSAGHES